MKIGSVVIDCINFDKILACWQDALHYVPRAPAKDGWVILCDTEGRKPNMSLQYDSERPTGRNWLHFDLYTNDQAAEVERLLKLGASRHLQIHGPGDDFIVPEDPDGNLFCAVDTSTH